VCPACNRPVTYEGIVDGYCQSDFGEFCSVHGHKISVYFVLQPSAGLVAYKHDRYNKRLQNTPH